MNNNNKYWEIHKVVYQHEFDKLDDDIVKIIMRDPNSEEAISFNHNVERIVEKELDAVLKR